MATCRSCGAEVQWRKNEGELIPLDALPSMRGPDRFTDNDDGTVSPVDPGADVMAYPDHRKTCQTTVKAWGGL